MNKETLSGRLGIRHSMDFGAIILILLSVVYGITACTARVAQSVESTVATCEITAPVDSLMETLFDSEGPGVTVMVMRNDTIMYNRSFGYARLDKPLKASDSTIFNISSASKLFTGVALMRMVEKGDISLDDSLSKFFPNFPKQYFDRIKIFHVLAHMSGLPDLRPLSQSQWDEYIAEHKSMFSYDRDYRRYGTETEHIRSFENLDTIAFEAGTHYDRRDISYVLIAPLIEAATGQNFDQWMKENIFDPAGLKETYYYHTDVIHPQLAHAYKKADPNTRTSAFRTDDNKWEEFDYDEADYFLTKADRGVCSSARDFMKFKRALVAGHIISDSSITKMLEPAIPTDVEYVDFGLGTAVRREPGRPAKAYHMNMNGGFACAECWWPEKNLHYIIFTGRNDWPQRAVLASVDSIMAAKGWI